MSNALKVFDSWPDVVKAREAKGLDGWSRLQYMASKLSGKKSDQISYTCAHPSHNGRPIKHTLGSKEGNLHFLMGYGNPGFHMLPYHWQVIDPNLTEEQAEELFLTKGHPSNPDLWDSADLDIVFEGEQDLGTAHATVENSREAADAAEDSVTADTPTGDYLCVPAEQKVYAKHSEQVYDWDMVKESYFAATNPEAVESMDIQEIVKMNKALEEAIPSFTVPQNVRAMCTPTEFGEDVYSLVKSLFPLPGSVIPISEGPETFYGVVSSCSVDFCDKKGDPVSLDFYGNEVVSIDLNKGGDSFPALVHGFAQKCLKLDPQLELVKSFLSESDGMEEPDGQMPPVVYEE